MSRPKKRKGGRVTPKKTRPRNWDGGGGRHRPAPSEPPPPALFGTLDEALHDESPLTMLALASSLAELAEDAGRRMPMMELSKEPDAPAPSWDLFVEMFTEVDVPQTTALLRTLELFAPGDHARRIRSELDRRRHDHQLPAWVRSLDEVEIVAVLEQAHVLGDGDNVVLAARWPSGQQLTLVTYIDHNMGTLVKDCFAIPAGPEDVVAIFDQESEDGMIQREIDPAVARARIEDAVRRWSVTWPPVVQDEWPTLRPLLLWLASKLPAGAELPEREPLSESAADELIASFLASPASDAVRDDPDTRSLVEAIVWFGGDYGVCDPLRWSSVRIEILLTDWFPRKVLGEVDYLEKLPDVLGAFVEFAIDELGRREDLDDDLVDVLLVDAEEAIERWELDYLEQIGAETSDLLWEDGERPNAYEMASFMLREMGSEIDAKTREHLEKFVALGPNPSPHELMIFQLGGEQAVAAIHADPWPPMEIDMEVVDPAIHDRVGQIDAIVERACSELLDDEGLILCRRVLADIVDHEPEAIGRPAAVGGWAAGILVAICQINGWLGQSGGRVTKTAIAAACGVKSVGTKDTTVIKAAGLVDRGDGVLVHLMGVNRRRELLRELEEMGALDES